MTAGLRRRFAAASEHEPLSALSALDRRELQALLASAEDLDDLPGRWQAALLSAEAGDDDGEPHGSCCHGH